MNSCQVGQEGILDDVPHSECAAPALSNHMLGTLVELLHVQHTQLQVVKVGHVGPWKYSMAESGHKERTHPDRQDTCNRSNGMRRMLYPGFPEPGRDKNSARPLAHLPAKVQDDARGFVLQAKANTGIICLPY